MVSIMVFHSSWNPCSLPSASMSSLRSVSYALSVNDCTSGLMWRLWLSMQRLRSVFVHSRYLVCCICVACVCLLPFIFLLVTYRTFLIVAFPCYTYPVAPVHSISHFLHSHSYISHLPLVKSDVAMPRTGLSGVRVRMSDVGIR